MLTMFLTAIALVADLTVVVVTVGALIEARSDQQALEIREVNGAYMAAARGEILAAYYRLAQGILLASTSLLIILYLAPQWPFPTGRLGPRVVTIMALIAISQIVLCAAAVTQRKTRSTIVKYVREHGRPENAD